MYKDLHIGDDIKIRRLGWAGHIIRMKMNESPERFLVGNFIIQDQGKNQNMMGGRHLEGHITYPRNTRMVQTSRRRKRMEASSEGSQGPQRAVTPQMDG
jgi:hypothetical protein